MKKRAFKWHFAPPLLLSIRSNSHAEKKEQGKLIASVMAALAEFERDLLRERVRSGIAAARARGVHFGRRPGQRIKADRVAPRVLALVATGHSYRQVGRLLNISKNTVLEIVKRAYATQPLERGCSLSKAKSSSDMVAWEEAISPKCNSHSA
jgi:DNA invertase Pin-like site-specific DNA recombinase